MSYRSPEIITDRSGEIIAQGFASFGQSIAGGLEKYASNQERLRKERDAETARMQKMKTELELEANSRAANFKANIPKTTFNERLNPIIDERLKEAADAKIALYQESDPAARAELLKTISNVDNFLLSTGEFVKQIQEEGSAWSEMKVTDINTTFGINGSDDESIKNNQGLLGFISGQSDADYNLAYDPKTNSITLDAKGKVGESQWAVNGFNSVDYLGSGGELLYSIPQIKEEVINSSTKLITDDKGKLLPGISKDMEFKRISANVKDANQKIIGKKVVEGSIEEINYSAINKLIDKEVKAGVAGFQTLPPMQQNAVFKNQLNGDQANINEFIKAFPTADAQNAELQRLFTKVASEGINEQFDSYGEGDKKVYYVATSPLKEVKPAGTGAGADKDKTVDPTIKNEIDAFIFNPYALLKKTTVFKEALAVVDPLNSGNPQQVTITKDDGSITLFDLKDPAEKERLFNEWLDRQGYTGTEKLKAKGYFLKNNSTLPIF